MAETTDSGTGVKAAGTPGEKTPEPQIKRFNNGWTKELEHLFAEWADKAACYRWMHERTGRIFYQSDQSLMFPIIILSTVTGAAQHAKLKVDGAAQTLSVRGAAAPRSAAETGWSILAK